MFFSNPLITLLVRRVRTATVPALLCLTLIALDSPRAVSLPQFLETAKTVYGFKKGGVIATAQCNLCHSGTPSKINLNLYGKAVQSVLTPGAEKHLTPAALQTLESNDSDGDGFSNGDEFKADTLPGDLASHPAGAAPLKTPPIPAAANFVTGSFSLRMTLLAKNAQHPALVHFPIALFMFSFFLDALGAITQKKSLHTAAQYNLVAAALSSLATMSTGLLAWWFKLRGAPFEGDLRLHILFAVTTSMLLFTLWAVRTKQKAEERPFTTAYLILAVVALITVAVTGHLGGVVSGVAG